MNELALFAGAGGGILGGKLLGWRTVCAVEIDSYARNVLLARQRDGMLEPFPIWDDVRTFDGTPWRGHVDVISGGFPCQDISAAGKGAGIDGERSGLWSEFARIICEVRPSYVFVENSPMLTNRGLGRVLGDLALLGYDAEWGVLGAYQAGAPHKRDRMWIAAYAPCFAGHARRPTPEGQQRSSGLTDGRDDVANTSIHGLPQPKQKALLGARRWQEGGTACELRGTLCDTTGARLQNWTTGTIRESSQNEESERPNWWTTEPALGRVAHGVARRVDRLKCIGNGQVPAVAALAWETLMRRVSEAV